MKVELVAMKRSNKEPEEGDVFVLQPNEGEYYYGKVIEARLTSTDVFLNNMYLVFIYDVRTSQKEQEIDLNGAPLLISPMIINKRLWTMGYFETIKKSYVTEYDLSVDYGFYDNLRKKHLDNQGDVISHKPDHVGVYGLGSFGAVAKEVHKALSKLR